MKASKPLTAFIFFLLLQHVSWCFTFNTNTWMDFSGKVNNKTVYLSLFQTNEGVLYGSYIDCDRKNKVLITGEISGNQVHLIGLLKGKEVEEFNLKNISDSTDRLQGSRVIKSTKQKSLVSFRLEAMCGGTLEHRYGDYFGVDDDVEQFMADIQTAVRTNDKVWMSKNVQYPIVVLVGQKKKLTIKNEAAFIQQYDKIFSVAFKNKIVASCTCNLFNNNSGVMLGDGEIWIYQKENSTEKDYNFIISAINNY